MKLIVLTLLLTGCATLPLNDPGKLYRKELKFQVDEQDQVGVANVGLRQNYEIEIKTENSTRRVRLTSCNVDEVYDNPGRGKIEYIYDVNAEVKERSCPLRIALLDEDGEHGWGIVDFQSNMNKLSAYVSCNNRNANTHGQYYCQLGSGQVMFMWFDEPTAVVHRDDCPTPDTKDDGESYQIFLGSGECLYKFGGVFSDERYRLTTFGYDDVFLRN